MTRLERARERETIRYYAAWLGSRRGYLSPKNVSRDHPLQPDDNEATQKISRDTALVAFAQLACLRLNAKRALVTLITTSTSYILAEATRTVSLLPGGQYADGDELWFGTASLPRSQGVSERALDAQPYTAKSPDGQEYTTPALILGDITQDPRYSAKEYAGRGVTFYAGVPIKSDNGFAIGVFNITDDKPRPGGLTSSELQFMQDMASTVMDHLENIRNDAARHRGERMVLGLGAFSEGHTALNTDRHDSDPVHHTHGDMVGPDLVRSTFKGLTISDTALEPPMPTPLEEEPPSFAEQPAAGTKSSDSIQAGSPTLKPIAASKAAPGSPEHVLSDENAEHGRVPIEPVPPNSLHSLGYRRTFARAANILHQCTDSDGVMFFDASSATAGNIHQGFFGAHRTHSNESTTSSDEAHYTSGGSSDDPSEFAGANPSQSGLKNKAGSKTAREKSEVKNCELLGFSFETSSTSQATAMVLKEAEMRRLLRRYPKGMVMHFTVDGNISSSEEGSVGDRNANRYLPVHNEKKRAVARELIKVVPGARNIVWLPLWDFTRSRWAAGCFLWTSRPGRLLSAQEDLIYMRAFANMVMGEINRLEAIESDQAKTSFVANISHELRTPLHGILGSIEFLHDTAIDTFQASMITTVETCGKTLLDTLNHVLDFAKLSKRPRQDFGRSNRRSDTDERASKLEGETDLSRLVEEVVESVYAGQTFRSTGAFHASESDDTTPDSLLQERIPVREMAHRTQSKFSGAVQVIVDVEQLDNWSVRTKPGAIRRIVMNLFGNALKYTETGWVCVSLSSTEDVSRDQSHLGFRVTVTDTGKGMSADFIKHHAWKPFSQEDSFANGTGLGLSIVRQITNSLGGGTTLQSQKDKGTVVSVNVTAPRAKAPDVSRDLVKAISQRTNGLKLSLLKPDIKERYGVDADASVRAEDSFTRMASSWFGMDVFSSKRVLGVAADFFLYMEPPPTEYLLEEHGLGTTNMNVPLIVIAPNAFESATLRKDTQKLKDLGRTIEIISQPCGPLKFANAIERCLDRDSSAAPPDITSPWLSEGKRQDIITVDTGTNNRALSPASSRATSRVASDQQVPKRLGSQSQSEIPSPSSDTGTDVTMASMDARVLAGVDTDPRSASNDKDGNELESTGPVLLVDDNEVNLKLLVAFVRKAKYAYETAMDGLEALNKYREASRDPRRAFKAVIIDIQMPVMDGLTATREIRAFESKNRADRRAIIMALTGLAGETIESECIQAGVDHFLAKPLRFKEFIKLLKQS